MIGILVQLAISWLIIWLVEKGNLSCLGFKPTKQRIIDFLLYFFIAALCCSAGFIIRIFVGNEHWILNEKLSMELFFSGLWWNVKSVLFEELIFRGVLFYLLIKRLGSTKAMLLSATAFGIYHWFSYGVLGNYTQMAIYFFITGIMGLIYAYGYVKTYSLYIPCAIHLGWNFTQSFVFSQGNIGEGILVMAKTQTATTVSYVVYYAITFLPLLSVWMINYLLLKKKAQVQLPLN